MTAKYLVTGASGQLGQRVLHHLLETIKVPAGDIVAASRKPEALADWAAKGVITRPVDFESEASMLTAFEGVERVLLISTDALGTPGLRLKQHKNAIAAAEKAGVQHVLYTSMPEPENAPLLFAPDHEGTEAALKGSTLKGWTILRNNWYFENIFLSAPSALASGAWYSASGDGKLAHISRDDLGRAAAVALAAENDGKNTYTLTGEASFSHKDIVDLINKVTGKSVAVIDVPVEGLVQGMVGAGLPEPVARVYASIDTNVAVGRLGKITGDFKTLTGVSPQSFEDWIASQTEALKALAG